MGTNLYSNGARINPTTQSDSVFDKSSNKSVETDITEIKSSIESGSSGGDYSHDDITSSATSVSASGKKISADGTLATTGKNIKIVSFNVLPYDEYVISTDVTPTEYCICLYDGNSAMMKIYNKTESGTKTYSFNIPWGASLMYVEYTSNLSVKKKSAEGLDYCQEKTMLSPIVPLSSNSGVSATIIETITGKRIGTDGTLIDDTRATLYKIKNAFYSMSWIGSSYGCACAAYDIYGRCVKVLVGGNGPHIYAEVPKVDRADYMLVQICSNITGILTLIKERKFHIKLEPSDFNFHPLPKNKNGLKILSIGNSFTIDIYECLPNLLSQAGINDVTLANTFISGGTLEQYYDHMVLDRKWIRWAKGQNSQTGSLSPNDESGYYRLKEIVQNEDWDIIFIQQSRAWNFDSNTFEPFAYELIKFIKENATKKDACVGFIQVWAPADEDTSFPQKKRWNGIVDTTKQLISTTGLDYVIPCGTAIQFGRNTDIETTRDWTRDGYHSDNGVAKYVEAATFFQWVFGQIYDLDIRDYNSFRTTNGTAVTDDNIDILNSIAYRTFQQRFFYEQEE